MGKHADLQTRVAAYLAEHPKASASWIAVALKTELWRVESALRGIERAATAAAVRARVLKLLAAGETYGSEIARACGIKEEHARWLLREMEAEGVLTSRTVPGRGLPSDSRPPRGGGIRRRYYKLAASAERAA